MGPGAAMDSLGALGACEALEARGSKSAAGHNLGQSVLPSMARSLYAARSAEGVYSSTWRSGGEVGWGSGAQVVLVRTRLALLHPSGGRTVTWFAPRESRVVDRQSFPPIRAARLANGVRHTSKCRTLVHTHQQIIYPAYDVCTENCNTQYLIRRLRAGVSSREGDDQWRPSSSDSFRLSNIWISHGVLVGIPCGVQLR